MSVNRNESDDVESQADVGVDKAGLDDSDADNVSETSSLLAGADLCNVGPSHAASG